MNTAKQKTSRRDDIQVEAKWGRREKGDRPRIPAGLHLLREGKKNRAMRGDKPKEPVWWKAPERWVEDPELLGLFFAFIGAGGIICSLWDFGRIAAAFWGGK